MTIKHLNALRLISLGLVCAAAVAAAFMAHRPQWLPLLACMLALLIWMRLLLSRMLRLVERLGYGQLDPDRLERELQDLSKLLRPSTRKNRNAVRRLTGLLHELRGEFPQAVDELLQIDRGRGGVGNDDKWTAIRLYLREGKPAMAKALIHQAMASNPAYTGPSGPVQLHTMGLFHLEQGELRQAGERLGESLRLAARRFTRLNCLYDLARLYERLDEAEKAVEHYRQAAELGPKTWLGRDAAGKCGERDAAR